MSFDQIILICIFFPSVIIILGPIYADLTSSISSDTILNLGFISFLSRLLFYDYEKGETTAVSLNSALFGAIILSSRLGRKLTKQILPERQLVLYNIILSYFC